MGFENDALRLIREVRSYAKLTGDRYLLDLCQEANATLVKELIDGSDPITYTVGKDGKVRRSDWPESVELPPELLPKQD